MKNRIGFLLLLSCLAGAVHAVEVAGVKLEDKARVTAAGQELVLNGAGLRTKVFFKVYVAALYVAEKKTGASEVLALKGPKRVLLTTVRDLTAEQLVDALNDGIRDNNGPADLERLKPQIDALNAIMLAAKEAAKGSVIALDWLPESGTRVTINGEARGAPITGEDFYAALLRIWLGEKPVEASLKRALLGGAQ